MTTPSYLSYRVLSSAANSIPVQSIRERQLLCLAVLVTQTNPDGTTKGS